MKKVLLGFVLGVGFVSLLLFGFSHQASYCTQGGDQSSQQQPADSHADAVSKSSKDGHTEPSSHAKKPARFGCGIEGIGPAFVHLMDSHEGFFMGVFTLLLVIVTAWLVYTTSGLRESTDKLWLAGEEQIKVALKAANAADLSARAAIALQLPIIRIHPDKLGHGETRIDGKEFEECFVPGVVIANLGPTKAFPLEILYGWTVGNELPPEPSYRFIDSFPTNIIFEPDIKITPRKRLTMAMPLEPGQWAQILKGNCLWFYCALRYKDFMGEIHTHGFCWRWAYVGMGVDWRGDDTPAYNRKT